MYCLEKVMCLRVFYTPPNGGQNTLCYRILGKLLVYSHQPSQGNASNALQRISIHYSLFSLGGQGPNVVGADA